MSLLINRIKLIQRACGAEVDGVFGPVTALAVMRVLLKQDDSVGEPPTLLDERTATTLATLDPKALDAFRQFTLLAQATAATLGCDYIAISGHRTWAEQDELYTRVPQVTRAKGGHSNHNFGIAVDYGVFQGGGRIYCDDSKPELARQVHAACAAHAKSCGLEWGGSWVGFKDFPHYELATGMTLPQKRKLYQQKGSVL